MTRPALQVALDYTVLNPALDAARRLAGHVDIIEAGTLLCFACGMDAVRALRADHPGRTLVADLKVADAGETLAELAFDAVMNLAGLVDGIGKLVAAVLDVDDSVGPTNVAAVDIGNGRHDGSADSQLLAQCKDRPGPSSRQLCDFRSRPNGSAAGVPNRSRSPDNATASCGRR